MRKYLLLGITLLSLAGTAMAQTLTLEDCLEQAKKNYPLIRQHDLISQSREFTIANAHAGYLPQLSINGQATYQSDVTRVPIEIPGHTIQPLSKDQYKVYAELNQSIYDGGTIRNTTGLQKAAAAADDQRIEVDLYAIRDRIHQLYFGILLIEQQLELNNLTHHDLQPSLNKADAALQNGTGMKMNVQILKAELLKLKQRDIELQSTRTAYLEMLSMFIHQPLTHSTHLGMDDACIIQNTTEIYRPEMQLFQAQRNLASSQYLLSTSRNKPKLGLYVQGGYGRPGLNALKNDFSTYYIGGIRLNWNLSGFYNSKRDQQLMEVNTRMVDTQQDLFLFNTRLLLKQQSAEMNKLDQLISVDDEIISLRANIKEVAKAQLDNGVMSANDYLRELNAEDLARQNKVLHNIQRQLAKVNYRSTAGNQENQSGQ